LVSGGNGLVKAVEAHVPEAEDALRANRQQAVVPKGFRHPDGDIQETWGHRS